MKPLLAAAALAALAASSCRASPPAWSEDPCAGLDCAKELVAVGQADLLPEMRLSSAVAYAEAARSLGSGLAEYVSINEKGYGEAGGQLLESAVKDLSRSPFGDALTKTYGDENADTISVAIKLHPIDAARLRVYAQEYVDPFGQTLYVRLVTSRAAADDAALSARLGAGFALWRGGRIRLASEDVRVGRRNEFTLWAEDEDAGVAWVERWPSGGGDLMRGGAVAGQFVYDRLVDRWKPAAPRAP